MSICVYTYMHVYIDTHMSTYTHTTIEDILKNILFIFRERGRKREREGEKHQCVVASHATPSEDLAYNPGMCPDW